MGEPNKARWMGVRPTDPAENIPVDVKVHTVNTPIIPASPEKVFTRLEPPDGCTYVDGQNEGFNNTFIVYDVPDNYTLYLTSIDFAIRARGVGEGQMFTRDANDLNAKLFYYVKMPSGFPFAIHSNYPIAKQIPKLYDICIHSDVDDIYVMGHIIGYLRPD